MRVAVLGAGGTVAGAIARDLAESAEVSALVLVDRDGGRLAAVAAVAAGQATPTETVELDAPAGLAEAIAGCQVLVNAAGYRLNLEAMEAALEAGCHYVDLGGLYWMTARQIELDERFIAAELIAVLGMGSSPGSTNVMADRAVRELGGERVLELVVSAARHDPADGDALRLPYALRTLIDELTMPPIVWEDGVPRELAPCAAGGRVEFPEPIGSAETIHTLHSEVQTLGRCLGVGRVSFRLALAPALRERLEALFGSSEEELDAAAAVSLPPSDQAVAAEVVEARTERRIARVTALTRPSAAWGLGGGIVATAAPAAAVVRLIARGKIEPVGVLPPEMCVEPDDLLPELEARGCAFTVEVSERSEDPA